MEKSRQKSVDLASSQHKSHVTECYFSLLRQPTEEAGRICKSIEFHIRQSDSQTVVRFGFTDSDLRGLMNPNPNQIKSIIQPNLRVILNPNPRNMPTQPEDELNEL